jgi:2',3'-cyclic-nucleotide 2'-phosphodiesterase/3'-nucleotidase
MHCVRLLLAVLLLAGGASARQVTVTLLVTTDLHGNIYPIDYFTGKPAERGLAKIASLVQAVRNENPNTLLVDCGDTIQGTPLESVYQHYVTTGRLPLGLTFSAAPLGGDPMMLAMNRLGYRAMVLGNHDFNFGLKNLEQARAVARFPWLSANTLVEPGSQVRPFEPYIVERLEGVKVAVIGVTTPAIPLWEEPEHYRGCRFLPIREAADSALAQLRAKQQPDVVVLAVHDGVDRALASSLRGIDAIVFGHTHQQMEGERIGDVLLVEPKNWGISLARLDFVLQSAPDGAWKLTAKRSRLLPVSENTPADPEILRLGRPYHELAERYLNTPVAKSLVPMDGRLARVQDSPLVDAIQTVQMHYGKADVSFTAMFNPHVMVPKGLVTIRQIAALYIYDNELYVIQGDGRMVKAALENAARYFLGCPDAACSHGPLIRRNFPAFNYDMAEGVEYEIDLSKPEGQRIVNLRWKGQPLRPDQELRIAINNYRAGGSGGYDMFRDAKVLWRSSQDIRSLIISYYTERKELPTRADGNWRIVPPQARKILAEEALTEAGR